MVSQPLRNRCGESKSPYVRAHADNPTAWQLWTPETIQLARDTNRLLFVSIGYSACHWCHVMAHESFDDPKIAQILNEHFIPVKIDREERPDIDRQYMDFVQATTGGGGWPLNVFVTPDLEPVFGGTYWPNPRAGGPSRGADFEQILRMMERIWREQEEKCRESGRSVIEQLSQITRAGNWRAKTEGEENGLELELLKESYSHYKRTFDSTYGGFGRAPKFPTPAHLGHLLKLSSYPPEVREVVGEDSCRDARAMVVKTLERMAKGGIKDQIGHGFARYSVTRNWSLPHFEKMLYDNAQLLPVYLDAYLVTKAPLFEETARDIATYLITQPMMSSLGGIHASEDADSLPTANDAHKREGAFYVWTMDEFKKILTEEEAQVCARHWNVQPQGNIERHHDIQGELKGQNTLCVTVEPKDLAKELSKSEDEIRDIIRSGRQKLLAYRDAQRPRPSLDDKIVTSWNGLAIGGLARAGASLNEPAYINAAVKTVECIRERLFDTNTGTLRRVYREGPGETPGFADDYAFLIEGLIDLYGATFDDKWLSFADSLQKAQIEQFWDADNHGFFSTPAGQPDILIRSKDAVDNAEPSTNGISASNLFRLAALLDDAGYEERANQTLTAFTGEMSEHPAGYSGLMSSLVVSKLGMKNLFVSGEGRVANTVVRKFSQSVAPAYTLLRIGAGSRSEWLRHRNDLLPDLDPEREMVQLCEGRMCRLLGEDEVEKLFAE
ncbi:hypothetical protein DL768_001536 [Monosporascus sp. mg162]|nr:hypothetical protein DL768_001536 [Monosporascus sp. mg162]